LMRLSDKEFRCKKELLSKTLLDKARLIKWLNSWRKVTRNLMLCDLTKVPSAKIRLIRIKFKLKSKTVNLEKSSF